MQFKDKANGEFKFLKLACELPELFVYFVEYAGIAVNSQPILFLKII